MAPLNDAARQLPPLLVLLELRARSWTPGAKSSDAGIPIDADALEIWAQIRDTLREWARQVRSLFHADSLVDTFEAWCKQFELFWDGGQVPDRKVEEITDTLESWVRMIRNKYDPPVTREWKSPCPKCGAATEHYDNAGVKVGEYYSSIRVNVTDRYAECSACGERFDGPTGIGLLRLLTNVAAQLSAGQPVDKAALAMYLEYRGVSDVA